MQFTEDTRFSAGYDTFLMEKPIDLEGGLFLLCEKGEADLILDYKTYHIKKGEEAVILTKKLFMVNNRKDFTARYFFCSNDFLRISCSNFTSGFYNTVDEHPVFNHSKKTISNSKKYFSMILEADSEHGNIYREIIISNLVRNLLLYIYNGIQSTVYPTTETSSDQTHIQAILDKFIEKVSGHCIHHRDVEYYAQRLCLSARYLNLITRQLTGHSPKEIIDNHAVNEIKTLLLFSDKTMEQIADTFHFPSQSSLGRYFKKATGFSPVEFRKRGLELPSIF